jgi:bacterioferritin-associated ferredoxin
MESCCSINTTEAAARAACPKCGRPGRTVERVTLKALLHSKALARLEGAAHRFCPTPDCPIVYFGSAEIFGREDLAVPVFQKEPAGDRTVCYCFGITESEIRREVAEHGQSTASERVGVLVKMDRCACELRNPQGSCCLGNIAAVMRALLAEDLGSRPELAVRTAG